MENDRHLSGIATKMEGEDGQALQHFMSQSPWAKEGIYEQIQQEIRKTSGLELKNVSQIEHTRHRSPTNCFINILAGLIAYCHQPEKPDLNFVFSAFPLLQV